MYPHLNPFSAYSLEEGKSQGVTVEGKPQKVHADRTVENNAKKATAAFHEGEMYKHETAMKKLKDKFHSQSDEKRRANMSSHKADLDAHYSAWKHHNESRNKALGHSN